MSLPSKECSYSKLKQCGISDIDYQQAIDDWKDMKCKTFRDYLMKYLTIDVLLMVDSLANFRSMRLESYEIDPCYATPGLTLLCGLKSGTKLKYYKEDIVNTYDNVESGIRLGLASVLGDCLFYVIINKL